MAHKPEHTDPENVPRRSKAELDPEEREFWELDDPPAGAAPPAEEPAPLPPETVPEFPVPSEEREATLEEPMPAPREEPPGTGEESPAPAPPEQPGERAKRRVSAVEMVSIGLVGIVLIAAAVWALGQFFEAIPTSDPTVAVEFPVKGSAIEISAVETYWRRPDATKDAGVRRETVLMPAAKVTLAGGGDCALRFFFEDESGSIVGDPRTLAVAGGRFAAPGAETTEVFGTAGFENEGNYAAYLAGTLDYWFLVVTEGPDEDARGSEFKEVLRIPISRSTR